MAGWSRRRESTAEEVLIRQLYQQHGGALLAYATRLKGDRARGEDVVQETLIRGCHNPNALVNDKGSVRGYLFTITRTIAIDGHPARHVHPAEVVATVSSTPAQMNHADVVVDSMVVLGAMETLSPEHQDVLRNLYFHGHSVEEATALLGVSADTVKSRAYHALRRLRAAIAERLAEHP